MQKDDDHLVKTYARQKIVFAHGKGVHLYDTQGREYLDFYSGIAVTSLGHGDPEFTTAVGEQVAQLVHVSNLFYNVKAGALAESLTSHSFAKRVFFCNSGTEAAEGAIKFARKWGHEHDPSGKKINILSFHGGFHGRTMGALSCTANPKYQKPFLPLIPGVSHAPFNDIAEARKAINDDTCAVFVEPIQGEGGVNVAEKAFLSELRSLCDKHNALLIFDEVQVQPSKKKTIIFLKQCSLQVRTRSHRQALGPRVGWRHARHHDARQGPRQWHPHWRDPCQRESRQQ